MATTTTTSSLIFLSFFLLVSSATCFNITKILGSYPDFSQMNQYITQAGLADDINSRQTITVLAVSNDGLSGAQIPQNQINSIMSLLVVLDYYDMKKLQALSKHTALLTTMFQSTGVAASQQGFLNVTVTNDGVLFGSAEKGSQLNSRLVRSVVAQPYNISVLEISAPIIPADLGKVTVPAGAPKQSPPPSKAPTPSPKKAPTPSPKKAPAPSPKKAHSPKAATPASAPAPEADAPAADTPSSAPAPADAPAADGPAADDKKGAADAPAPGTSSASRIGSGMIVGVVLAAVSSWFGL